MATAASSGTDAPSPAGDAEQWGRRRQLAVIFLVSMAGLLLEVSYTRIVSFKLWYYYTYLVLGLALLGIGTGAVLVTMWGRIRTASTEKIMSACGLWGAVSIALGYLVVARIPVNTVVIWEYGTGDSFKNLGVLGIISFTLFASFIAFGVMVSVILGRGGERVGTLYFADLLGAGLGCLVVIPLITALDPPAVVMVAAAGFGLAGVIGADKLRSTTAVASGAAVVVLAILVGASSSLPDVRIEGEKVDKSLRPEYSEWGPVFRVDVYGKPGDDTKLLAHDGSYGSGIHRYDGDPKSQTRFDRDSRSIPFRLMGDDGNDHTLIIGSAGGNEILASLYFGSRKIEGVELNPVTVGLLKGRYADYTGHLDKIPNVAIHQADGRSFLARSTDDYDLVWYVAPDSYAANNAASSGAFVLSESYLYTVQMIEQTLRHLSDDGIMVVQFGELDYVAQPNRTERYVNTAREALRRLGVSDPTKHMIVAAEVNTAPGVGDLATIILKRTEFTPAEVARAATAVADVPHTQLQYAPGERPAPGPVGKLASLPNAEAERFSDTIGRNVGPVTDDAPFFWHFAGFDSVIGDLGRAMKASDPEDSIGERVLLLLLGIAIVYAAVFLLLPFAIQRRRRRREPDATETRRPPAGTAAVYFASLGLGFMLIEITMIQRLTLLLGYPTYSLTVTLASILVSTGVGALVSPRLAARTRHPLAVLWVTLAVMVVVYQFLLDPITDALLPSALGVRILVALLVLAPTGFCLGMFMPLGLREIDRLSSDGERQVAWSWAVNGFFSVIGSVLTTILSMTFGFRVVMFLSLAVYSVAVAAYGRLRRTGDPEPEQIVDVTAANAPEPSAVA